MKVVEAVRYHDISCGHRVVGHEGACQHIHGHNYRITFTCQGLELDAVGRVIDFSSIKAHLCEWLDKHWDHRFLAWEHDPFIRRLSELCWQSMLPEQLKQFTDSIVWVPFNPTAENIGLHLLNVVGPEQLYDVLDVQLVKVFVSETRKCGVEVSL